MSSLCIFWITVLYQIRLLQYFLPVYGLSSYLLDSVFHRVEMLDFNEVQLIRFFFHGSCLWHCIQKVFTRLPVSCPTCKGSHCILPTSNKLNRLKIKNSSWIHYRGEDTGQIASCKIGETDMWIQGVMADWIRDSQEETSTGTSAE